MEDVPLEQKRPNKRDPRRKTLLYCAGRELTVGALIRHPLFMSAFHSAGRPPGTDSTHPPLLSPEEPELRFVLADFTCASLPPISTMW